MSIVLSAYSETAYKEFLLPAANDLRVSLSIRRDVFGLEEDLVLNLENEDGVWFLAPDNAPGLIDPQRRERPALEDGGHFLYQAGGRTVVYLAVSCCGHRFESFPRYRLAGTRIEIGAEPGCALQYSFVSDGGEYISRRHASIALNASGMLLTDTSASGVFVNDVRVRQPVQLQFGDRIDIWGLNLVALDGVLAIRPHPRLRIDPLQLAPADLPRRPLRPLPETPKYHRAPRRIAKLAEGEIVIEAPPAPEQDRRPPLLMTIGPAMTMTLPMVAGSALAVFGASSGGSYMYTGIVTAVLSAGIGTLWALVNANYGRKSRQENEARRFNAYSEYLIRIAADIRREYDENTRLMLETYPSARQCLANGCAGVHLWERNPHHPDFLCYRLGLGDVPFQKKIRVPQDRFELSPDNLRRKPGLIRDNFQTLRQVPVCVDLAKERLVGLVGGPDRSGARGILYGLMAQIAVQNCYTDVKLAFVYREEPGGDPEKWAWCRWLPHVWSEGRKCRYVAANSAEASDVLYELAAVLRARSEAAAENGSRAARFRPWYIVVLEDASVLENEPAAKYLLDPAQNLGVCTLFLAEEAGQLPNACDCILRSDAAYSGMYHAREADLESGRLQTETCSPRALEQLARSLCRVEVNEIEMGGEIPASVTFLDMYGVARPEELHAAERWKRSRTYENLRVLIGQKAGGQPCYLDVHEKYHGPHGLVAGTTGSGKSETLQTYILSLALNFSPYDVGLFLIDYKGGGMANLFTGLPHTMGSISNLSGRQIQRAMVSIKSENRRRQRIFNENGVNNINLYTALYKNGEASQPVPHLFIIIDEFAELKREQPDFMRELISVAQVGRSLGVHLILATQKPGGTVDDNISSNARFRLCLRVQDRQDSIDMLHRPDAAYLTQAGRGFLQVGSDEVFEQFQSGWSGAAYDEETAGSKQVLARMLTNPGKTALVGGYVQRRQREALRDAWLTRLNDLAAQALEVYPDEEPGRPNAVTREIYCLLAENKIEYPESEGNTRALEALVQLVRQADTRGIPADKRGRWLAAQAARQGLRLPERKEHTQLDAVVAYLAATAREQGYQPLPPLWLNPLPGYLPLQQLDGWQALCFADGHWPAHGRRWELAAPAGMMDDPQNQSQLPLEVNFTRGGHHALLGAASSGKSTFVQTLLFSLMNRFAPYHLTLYVLDFSTRLTQPFLGAPHVGGILFEDDLPRVGKLFYLLQTLLAERKRLFQGGDYGQYTAANGAACPAVLLVIDNMSNFREKTRQAYDEDLIRLARQGASCGIYLLVTGGDFSSADIPPRLGDQLRTTLTLQLADAFAYGAAMRIPNPETLPESGVPGRGLADHNGAVLEYQTALALPIEDAYARAEALEAACRAMADTWQGEPARAIPFIPENPVLQDLLDRPETADLLADDRHLPIGYDFETAGIYSVDLRYTYCYVVSGRARTGKTNLLRLFLRMAKRKGMRVSVLEPEGAALKNEAEKLGADHCATLEELVAFVSELGETFHSRKAVKTALLEQGAEEDELYAAVCREPAWLIVIDDLVSFVERVSKADAQALRLDGALTNLIGAGFLYNIYFVAGMDPGSRGRVSGRPVYEEFVKDKNGIHLGGNVSAQSLFEFSDLPFSEQSKPEKPGVGLTPSRGGESVRRVILPQVRG